MLPTASPVRAISETLGSPRFVKWRAGQPRRAAISASFLFGFTGRGRPTTSSSGRSSWLSV